MGQTYSQALNDRNVAQTGIDTTLPELSDLSYERSLGTSRFLKTIRARSAYGPVVVKVFVKPVSEDIVTKYVKRSQEEMNLISSVPNALPYHKIVNTPTAVYILRQYLASSLYDRISTRPFLEEIEKRWIAYQLLCGLRECHAAGVYHGDIKTENLFVTTWNWIYLSDFSSFKPTYLPEDNPADFSFFFDTSSRRVCYVAPERFLSPGEKGRGGLNEKMDIFSLGCVIAELFTETPLFTLSQLFKYRKGDYDPTHTILDKIEDADIRTLVQHMINVNPEERFSAEQYLNRWRRKAFPEYFYTFLHQYVSLITDPRSGRYTSPVGFSRAGEADERIERIFYDFDKISFFLGYDNSTLEEGKERHVGGTLLPLNLDIPNYHRQSPTVQRRKVVEYDGTLIFLALVVSSLRNTARSTARVRGCDLLLAFAERIPDDAKLDRVLPYLISFLTDPCVLVQVAAIRSIAQLLELVEEVSQVNLQVFSEYIIPKLSSIPNNKSPLVKATYAACLSSLADSAARLLDMAQAMKANALLTDPDAEDGESLSLPYQSLFDESRSDLVEFFKDHAKELLTDSDPSVRRAFLESVPRLCVFFGNQKANDVILSHLNTYLNDKDWQLRSAFFDTIISVATYVGGTSLEDFIMPLMVQALTDPEEKVVEKVVQSLAAMAALGLFQRPKLWELVDIVARFTMHPNLWIREAAVAFIVSSTKYLQAADIHCILKPLIRPFLRCDVVKVTEISILESLKDPLSRNVFDMAVTWATKAEKGIFWKSALEFRAFSFSAGTEASSRLSGKELGMGRIPKNEEDEQWMGKLRALQMRNEDEWKLFALGDYIWKMARTKARWKSDTTTTHLNTVISLQDLGVQRQMIFFDEKKGVVDPEEVIAATEGGPRRGMSLAEALLDASKTIDNPLRRTGSRTTLNMGSRAMSPAGSEGRGPGKLTINTTQPGGVTIPSPSGLKTPTIQVQGSSGESSILETAMAEERLVRTKTASIPHKSSIVSLIGRGTDGGKAAAETGAVFTMAFGRLEQPPVMRDDGDLHRQAVDKLMQPQDFKYRAAHSYEGSDPHVLKLLDNLFVENYPTDIIEFGPTIVPLTKRQPIKRCGSKTSGSSWRPEGTFVAQFGEHSAAINRVVVAPDHAFFLTASDDGTVKIWDSSRLEKNVTTRAKQTFRHGIEIKVKAICFVENTHCFCSAATDGSIFVVKVAYSPTSSGVKFGKLRKLRSYQLPEGEQAMWMEHFKLDNTSVLLVATNQSRILAIDLRTMTTLYTLQNPVHHGTPTCFVVDKKRTWLLLGTTHGVLDLWDLRFRLRLKAWGLPGASQIHRLTLHPSRGRGKWVLVAGGTGPGEVSTWDVEKGSCREVFKASSSGKDSGKGYEAWKVDEDGTGSEGMLGRFATTPSHLIEPNPSAAADRGVRALWAGIDVGEEGGNAGGRDGRGVTGFMVTAGADRKVRFWNLSNVEGSTFVSGLESGAKCAYSSSQYTPTITLNTERILPVAGEGGERMSRTASSGGAGAGAVRGRKGGRPPRSTVISQEQQDLLKCHLDSVLDVAVLEVPYGMVLSADRSGVLFVFQ